MQSLRKLVPPIYLVLTLLIMSLLHYFWPLARIIPQPWNLAGIFLILAGFGLTAAGAATFRRAGTPVRPFEQSTAVVTHGLFRFTRNPMYLGMLIILAGTAVAFGSLSAWFPIPVFYWIVLAGFIRGEEQYMQQLFGEEYLRYKEKVRRWL